MDKLSDEHKEKRPELVNRKGVVFQQDNARPLEPVFCQQGLTFYEHGINLLPERCQKVLHKNGEYLIS